MKNIIKELLEKTADKTVNLKTQDIRVAGPVTQALHAIKAQNKANPEAFKDLPYQTPQEMGYPLLSHEEAQKLVDKSSDTPKNKTVNDTKKTNKGGKVEAPDTIKDPVELPHAKTDLQLQAPTPKQKVRIGGDAVSEALPKSPTNAGAPLPMKNPGVGLPIPKEPAIAVHTPTQEIPLVTHKQHPAEALHSQNYQALTQRPEYSTQAHGQSSYQALTRKPAAQAPVAQAPVAKANTPSSRFSTAAKALGLLGAGAGLYSVYKGNQVANEQNARMQDYMQNRTHNINAPMPDLSVQYGKFSSLKLANQPTFIPSFNKSMSDAFSQELAKQLIGDPMNKMQEILKKRLLDEPTHEKVFLQAVSGDPDLSQHDPEVLRNSFSTLKKFAPSLAKDPNTTRSFLTQSVMTGGKIDYATIRTLAETEKFIQNAKGKGPQG